MRAAERFDRRLDAYLDDRYSVVGAVLEDAEALVVGIAGGAEAAADALSQGQLADAVFDGISAVLDADDRTHARHEAERRQRLLFAPTLVLMGGIDRWFGEGGPHDQLVHDWIERALRRAARKSPVEAAILKAGMVVQPVTPPNLMDLNPVTGWSDAESTAVDIGVGISMDAIVDAGSEELLRDAPRWAKVGGGLVSWVVSSVFATAIVTELDEQLHRDQVASEMRAGFSNATRHWATEAVAGYRDQLDQGLADVRDQVLDQGRAHRIVLVAPP